jgi:hypothetical protein
MNEATKSLHMRRLLGLALLLQWFGAAAGTTLAPHPPKWYPLSEYLVSDVLFGLSLAPLLPVLRRGGPLARSVAVVLCLTLSVHIVSSVRSNGPGLLRFLQEWFQS